jgi:hypothetical protein
LRVLKIGVGEVGSRSVGQIVWKGKRREGGKEHPAYSKTIERLTGVVISSVELH